MKAIKPLRWMSGSRLFQVMLAPGKITAFGVIAVLLVVALEACKPVQHQQQLLESCQNHRAHLNMGMLGLALERNEKTKPPFQADVPGYAMLGSVAGSTSGALNCNHGAPGARIGGWQAVNLPLDKWTELQRVWITRFGGGELPFYWCGKQNPLQKRVLCTLILNTNGDWVVDHNVVKEAELQNQLEELNRCLSEIGLPPVTADVPDEVPWASFDTHGPGP